VCCSRTIIFVQIARPSFQKALDCVGARGLGSYACKSPLEINKSIVARMYFELVRYPLTLDQSAVF
jgi:hypothetical protein